MTHLVLTENFACTCAYWGGGGGAFGGGGGSKKCFSEHFTY